MQVERLLDGVDAVIYLLDYTKLRTKDEADLFKRLKEINPGITVSSWASLGHQLPSHRVMLTHVNSLRQSERLSSACALTHHCHQNTPDPSRDVFV